MMEISTGCKTEEDENELSLELSIGRKCYNNKTTTTTTLPPKSLDLPIIDLPLKREIQALRRQEARKKRDEKLKFKSKGGGGGGGDHQNGNVCCVINHEDHGVVDEDEEDEEDAEMPPRKKEKCQSFSYSNNNYNNYNTVVLNVGQKEEKEKEKLLVRDLDLKMNHDSGLMGESPCSYPNLPAMQYVPFTNGFVYQPSCLGSVVACTNGLTMDKDKRISFGNAAGGNEGLGKDKRVSFDPAACRSFRPYGRNIEMNVVNGKSDASSGGISPAVSDHHNSSLQGGSSSINFPQENRYGFSAASGSKKSDIRSWDSMGMVSNEVKVKTKASETVNMTSSTNIQDRESKCGEELKPTALLRDPAPVSNKNSIDHAALLKKETSNAIITNPLKPQTECNGASHLPPMPCVSTTGNGPNGRTITGFLYRYTKTEVCIVCVCHGTSFSPAEFVKHAGGVDVEHPLRHITIVPSDLA